MCSIRQASTAECRFLSLNFGGQILVQHANVLQRGMQHLDDVSRNNHVTHWVVIGSGGGCGKKKKINSIGM